MDQTVTLLVLLVITAINVKRSVIALMMRLVIPTMEFVTARRAIKEQNVNKLARLTFMERDAWRFVVVKMEVNAITYQVNATARKALQDLCKFKIHLLPYKFIKFIFL